jgi:hypothetical protein
MEYQVLTQDEIDDIEVNFLLAQERDHYCHTSSLARLKTMLSTLPDGEIRKHYQQLHDDTTSRLVEVSAIITASSAKIPTKERMNASIARIRAAAAAAAPKTS